MKELDYMNDTERVISLDTETTGLTAEDKIIEIGAVELLGSLETGRRFHVYINPYPRKVHPDAQRVHGLSDQFLFSKPKFRSVYRDFLDFIGDAPLVIHNARFDMGFLKRELNGVNSEINNPVIDTLELARKMFPGQRATLDALCARFGIDNSNRTLHGALIDASLLAQVFVKLSGRDRLDLRHSSPDDMDQTVDNMTPLNTRVFRESRGVVAPTEGEIAAHESFIKKNIPESLWAEIIQKR